MDKNGEEMVQKWFLLRVLPTLPNRFCQRQQHRHHSGSDGVAALAAFTATINNTAAAKRVAG
jgi:hypothetical protein